MRSLHANMDPQPAEGNCDDPTTTTPWNLTSQNSTSAHGVNETILITWPTAIHWVNVPSSGPQNCFSTFWI